MNKIFKRVMSVLVLSLFLALMIANTSHADSKYTVKIPLDATISVKGATLTENNLIATDFVTGRIHDIAAQTTGIVYGYKYYTVSNFNGMDDLIVYDRDMVPLLPVNISVENRLIEYATSSQNFILTNAEKIKGAAIAYHNRTGGYGSGGFYNYFLKGSDAAMKCELSDGGRYWGQFVTARLIENVEIVEVVPYGNAAFTAKVKIVADGGGRGYVEDYTISMLFQNVGGNYYVTNFTFMK